MSRSRAWPAADLTIGGSSTGWSVASITGTGAAQTVRLVGSGTPSGTLTLTLKAGSVVDRAGLVGPSTATAAPTISIDHTVPGVTTPTLSATTTGIDPIQVSTTVTDASGVAGAQLRLDGGPWQAMGALDGAPGGTSEAFVGNINDPVVAVDAGREHSCAVTRSGSVRCWGGNAVGQLGDGTTTQRTTSVRVAGITDAVAVAAGNAHTCALLSDGTVRCWGLSAYEASPLGPGSTASLVPVPVDGITTAIAIDAGAGHTCAVLSSGGGRCWGSNSYGQLGDGTTTGSSVPVAVSSLTDAVAITTGGFHTCAIRSSGLLRCWGINDYGALGDGTLAPRSGPVTVVRGPGSTQALTGVRSVSTGMYHTCASLADGTARCWGFQNSGVMGNGSFEVYNPAPVVVSGLTDAMSISSGGTGLGGYSHACATRSSGAIRCWGFNSDGQIGDGTAEWRSTPVDVSGIVDAVAISGGWNHTCALSGAGRVRCWGSNLDGRVGDGTATLRAIPTRVAGLSDATRVAVGGTRTRCRPARPLVCLRPTRRRHRGVLGLEHQRPARRWDDDLPDDPDPGGGPDRRGRRGGRPVPQLRPEERRDPALLGKQPAWPARRWHRD